ncbi:MAG: hypothetical protein ACFCU8_06780 [Thermosynechococcaceae cyanobacterium]
MGYSVELFIFIAAGVVAWLLFTWLLKVVKTTLKTAFMVAVIVMILAIAGIGPEQLWQAVLELPQQVGQLLNQS